MPSSKPSAPWKLAALAMLLTLSACASSSPPPPPVIAPRPVATPLPASVSQIDPSSSQPLLQRVESYLQKLDVLSRGETPK